MSARLRNHITFWIAYLCFKAFLNYSGNEPLSWLYVGKHLLSQAAFLPVKIPLVYGCFYVTDKYLESRWRLYGVVLILALAFPVCAYAIWLISVKVVYPFIWQVDTSRNTFGLVSGVYLVFTLLFLVGIALSIRLFRRQYILKLHKAQLEKEMTESELKYLKSQLNPHFLFNTLNNIYSLARKGSEHTAESIMKLSALMRFMLYETSAREIPLKVELKIIGDYLELEKLRYDMRLNTEFTTQIDNPDQLIAPLLLIHFVENAFKHGASETREQINIRISIVLHKSILTAEISNPLGERKISGEPVHIGLDNIKRQLRLLYPRHALEISTQNERFDVKLMIPLTTVA